MEHLAVILTSLFAAVSTLIAGWFAYNKNNHEKRMDLKIEQVRQDSVDKAAKNSRNIAVIYGDLWQLLLRFEADRCFIIQPHPENKYMYISVFIEVYKKGVSAVREVVKNIPMSEAAIFSKQLATEAFMCFNDIDRQVKDLRIKSLMKIAGSTNIAIKQLVNIQNEWVGSLVVENTANKPFDNNARDIMEPVAHTIQFILPPIK